jgi:hypothetical protein
LAMIVVVSRVLLKQGYIPEMGLGIVIFLHLRLLAFEIDDAISIHAFAGQILHHALRMRFGRILAPEYLCMGHRSIC